MSQPNVTIASLAISVGVLLWLTAFARSLGFDEGRNAGIVTLIDAMQVDPKMCFPVGATHYKNKTGAYARRTWFALAVNAGAKVRKCPPDVNFKESHAP